MSDSVTPYSAWGFSVHGVLQARILEGVSVSSFRGSSQRRDWTPVPALQANSLPLSHRGSLVYRYMYACIVVVDVSLSHVWLFVTPWTDCSTPGLPVHHQLPEFAQTHVYWVDDAIQPSHPLLPPSPSALNLSQNQGLFQRVGSSHQVAKALEFQLQHTFFQWIFKVDFL